MPLVALLPGLRSVPAVFIRRSVVAAAVVDARERARVPRSPGGRDGPRLVQRAVREQAEEALPRRVESRGVQGHTLRRLALAGAVALPYVTREAGSRPPSVVALLSCSATIPVWNLVTSFLQEDPRQYQDITGMPRIHQVLNDQLNEYNLMYARLPPCMGSD